MNVANVIKELIEIYPKAEEILGSTLPDSLNIERLARIARSEFNKALNANDFSTLSFLKAAITSINLDLEPEQGDTYFISCDQDIKTLISLKGIIKLVHKSNRFHSFEVNEVWEKDIIEVIHGQNKTLIHKPYLRGDRGELIGFNCQVHSLERGHAFMYGSCLMAFNFELGAMFILASAITFKAKALASASDIVR